MESCDDTLVFFFVYLCQSLQALNNIDEGSIVHKFWLWKWFYKLIENIHNSFDFVELQIFRAQGEIPGNPNEILSKYCGEKFSAFNDFVNNLNKIEVHPDILAQLFVCSCDVAKNMHQLVYHLKIFGLSIEDTINDLGKGWPFFNTVIEDVLELVLIGKANVRQYPPCLKLQTFQHFLFIWFHVWMLTNVNSLVIPQYDQDRFYQICLFNDFFDLTVNLWIFLG